MIFFLIFLKFIYSNQKIELLGDWEESNPIIESIIFFKKFHPELLDLIEAKLNKNLNFSRNDILFLLKDSISIQILKLLNISLQLKFFHPAAVSKNPFNNNKKYSNLRGWGISIKNNTFNINIDHFFPKLLYFLNNNNFLI